MRTEAGYQAQIGEDLSIPVTVGDIMADLDWGRYYYLDPQTTERNVRKRYLIEDAKHELQALLDEQITIDEIASGYTSDVLRDVYTKRAEAHEATELAPGFLAEKMVRSFFTKMSYDFPESGISIEETDAFDDVNNKIDFVIRHSVRSRGVDVDADTSAERVGIQFTTTQNSIALERKQSQVEEAKERVLQAHLGIDDVVLVHMPAAQIVAAHDLWRENPVPGGPDAYWDRETKEQVFGGVMTNILTPEQVQEYSVCFDDTFKSPAAKEVL